MKTAITLCFALCIAAQALPASVLAAQHTGYWKQRTPKGTTRYPCKGVFNKEDLVNVLINAGWVERKEDSVPSINWEEEAAIVVAPLVKSQGWTLTFYGLKPEGEKIQLLLYGWAPEEEVGSEEAYSSTRTVGITEPTTYETIVVAYPRVLRKGKKFICREVKGGR